MTSIPPVLREASTYMVGLVGAAALQFVAVPVLTRYLGPSEYSVLALVLAVTTSIAGILLVGGDLALTRFWFSAPTADRRRSLAVSWISLLTLWSLIPVGLAVLASPWLSSQLSGDESIVPLLIIGFAILIPAQLSRMLAQVLRNSFRPRPFAATSIGIAAMSLALGLSGAVLLDLGVAGVLLGVLCGETLGVALRAVIVMPALRGARPSTSYLRAPLLFGIPFIPASVAFWVFTGMDRIAVGSLMKSEDLGSYAVAAMLVAPFTILLTALGQAWMPRVTQDFETDPERAIRQTGAALETSLVVYGFGAVVVGALSQVLIKVVAGPDYLAGAGALPLLALGSAILGTSIFASTGFTLAKRTLWAPVVTVSAAAVDIVLLFVLVPRMGLAGAGAAVAISYFVLTAGFLAVSQTFMPIPVRWHALLVMLVCLTVTALMQSLQPGNPWTITCSAATLLILARSGISARRHYRVDRVAPLPGAQPQEG